ncbi:unnamed protein product [Mytilus edulis]|uniref:B box-type domain-containing protein n=1 Tax=Mytilus edulis TaxID=6550 RepID=A0A8S3V866_MYTED|nr:unnamed protein product [Mytilus edulis]
MFCRTCDVLVCPECISDSHRKHDLDSIDKVCSEKKSELQDLESQFSNKFELCKIESSKVQDFKTKYEQFYTEAVKKNDQQEKFILDEVRKYAKDIREQLKSERQRIEKSVTEKEKDIAEVKENLLNKQSNIQEVLESNQGAQVFSAYPEFSKKDIPNASFNDFPEDTKDFIPAEDNLKNISNLFGSLQKTKLPKGLPQVNLDVIKSYTTDQFLVERTVMMDDKTAWISNYMTSSLKKIIIDDIIKCVKDISVKVHDMSLTENNDVLLSVHDSTDVSLLTTKTGEVKPFLSLSPLYPHGIHVTIHNEIILGVIEKEGSYNLTNKSCRKKDQAREILVFEKVKWFCQCKFDVVIQ